MLTFSHVEDYIEVLAGFEPGGNSTLFNTNKYKFSLARYDVNIIQSMSNASMWSNMSLTDKQGELAIKLIQKYKRQFASQGISIEPIEFNPVFRLPLRKVDRTQAVWLNGDTIQVKFPYNQNWIDDFRKFKEISQGRAKFNYDLKLWDLGLTEFNINWVVAWGEMYKFDIAPEIQNLYNKILDAENTNYKIELVSDGNQFTITNAHETLINYVNENLGGFGLDNLVSLIDNAGVLGYSIDPNIKYPKLLDLFGADRTVHVPSTETGSLDLIFDYAELTDRWPVCIYNPGTTQPIDLSRFNENEIVRFDPAGRTKTPDYNYYTIKVIYANKIPKHWEWPIPLLVSTVEMMYGGSRMEWINRAEKIIHYSYVPLREKNGNG